MISSEAIAPSLMGQQRGDVTHTALRADRGPTRGLGRDLEAVCIIPCVIHNTCGSRGPHGALGLTEDMMILITESKA